jgi:uncharacterized membrane protein YhaH (DUF805 family)
MTEYISMWKNGFNFSGRATRREYWVACTVNLLIGFAMGFIFGESGASIFGFYYLLVIIPSLALLVRRLHDINKSASWLLIPLVPFFGLVILLVFLCTATVYEDNIY